MTCAFSHLCDIAPMKRSCLRRHRIKVVVLQRVCCRPGPGGGSE